MERLNLIVLRCADVERSRAFYEVFGMNFEKHVHGSGPEHYAHEDGRGVFELYRAQHSAPGGDRTGLGFAVPDLIRAHAALVTLGFAPGEPEDRPWGRSFVVRDPDARRVEVKAI